MRPIIFDAVLATGRDDVVFAHLNYRLVQMCLRLLRAEIWSLGTQSRHLSHVSACIVSDSALKKPMVLAHGRIVELGGDNHRLHEEIISAGGALYTPPSLMEPVVQFALEPMVYEGPAEGWSRDPIPAGCAASSPYADPRRRR